MGGYAKRTLLDLGKGIYNQQRRIISIFDIRTSKQLIKDDKHPLPTIDHLSDFFYSVDFGIEMAVAPVHVVRQINGGDQSLINRRPHGFRGNWKSQVGQVH